MSGKKEASRAVLGLDAAWTETEPSGVALAIEAETGWRLVAVEASYEAFLARARGDARGDGRPRGSRPDAGALIEAVRAICGRSPDCVAVDMPVAPNPIKRRRVCDNIISGKYGARKAAVHSPSEKRPGPLSDALRAGFAEFGLTVRTKPPAHGLIEVYPHAALIEFMGAPERLKYKVSKTLTYWRGASVEVRHRRLREVWEPIVAMLDERIAGVMEALPVPATEARGSALKAFEDKLDAVVCAAVAITALDGRAVPHGDADGAIWVPGST